MVRRLLLLSTLLAFGCQADDPAPTQKSHALPRIHLSSDKKHFAVDADARFELWGFNYDHDEKGRLLEDYWAVEWEKVRRDFVEMKSLGGNVIRIHLQVAKFMNAADKPNAQSLVQLGRLVKLAEETGLYLDITGLACYRKGDVPAWYSSLDESHRWDVQCRFWKAVAGVCKTSPAIFCYDLMNEPIIGGGDQKSDWLPGTPLGGMNYVQRLTLDPHGRSDKQIARAWVEKLSTAIRSVDKRHMITVGVIPWVQVFKGGSPLFYSPEVSGPLDFASIHFYPKAVPVEESLKYLRAYEIGKPLVIEEIFPLDAGIDKTAAFINASRNEVDGYVSFYWGETIEQNKQKHDLGGAIQGDWLQKFEELAPRQ